MRAWHGESNIPDLEEQNTFNVAVFVVWHYGNRHLGPVWFHLIGAAAKTALTRMATHVQASVTHSAPGTAQNGNSDGVASNLQVNRFGSFQAQRKHSYASVTSPQPFSSFTSKLPSSWGAENPFNKQRALMPICFVQEQAP